MRAATRTSRYPYDRRSRHPVHPVGRARRRWPRMYDGGEEQIDRRYRRDFEQDRRVERRRATRQRMSLDALRQTPLRNGLIGLAVAGTAAPIAINRYQQALRVDASHEQRLARTPATVTTSDSSLTSEWHTLEQRESAAEEARNRFIQQKLTQYAEYNLSEAMAEEIYDSAIEADVDPDVAFGLVRAESSFQNTVTSVVGAIGLTQLMPATAKWLEKGITNAELRDPETNLRIGFRYLKQLTEKYNGDTDLALVAYNRGPGTVDRILKRGGDPDNGYADFVRTGDVGSHTLRSGG